MSDTREQAARDAAEDQKREGAWQCLRCWRWLGDDLWVCPECPDDDVH